MKKYIIIILMLCVFTAHEASAGLAGRVLGRAAAVRGQSVAPRPARAVVQPSATTRPNQAPRPADTAQIADTSATDVPAVTTTAAEQAVEQIDRADRIRQLADIAKGSLNSESNQMFWKAVYGGVAAAAAKVAEFAMPASQAVPNQAVVLAPVVSEPAGQLIRVAAPFPVEGGVSAALPRTGPEGWTRGDIHDLVQSAVGGIADSSARQAVRSQIYSSVNLGLVMAAKASDSGIPAPLYRTLMLNPSALQPAELNEVIKRFVPAEIVPQGQPAEIAVLEDQAAALAPTQQVTDNDWRTFLQSFVTIRQSIAQGQTWQQFREQMLNFENPQSRNRAIAALIVLGALLYWYWGDDALPIENSGLAAEAQPATAATATTTTSPVNLPNVRLPQVTELTDFKFTPYDHLVKMMLQTYAPQILGALDAGNVVNVGWANGVPGLVGLLEAYNAQLEIIDLEIAPSDSIQDIADTIRAVIDGFRQTYP